VEKAVFVQRQEVDRDEEYTLLFLPIFCYCLWCLLKWLISWGNFKGTFYGEDWGCQKVPFGGLESSIFPIKEGGLSIKKLSSFNQALLG